MTLLACSLDLESRFALENSRNVRIDLGLPASREARWLKPNKAACKFAANLPIFAVKFAHSVGQFARGDFLAETGCIELSSSTITEAARHGNRTGLKWHGTERLTAFANADRSRWRAMEDPNPFNSRLTKRPLCRLTHANPPEPFAPPDRPRPWRKVELSDQAVSSIGRNALRRNRPRAIVPHRYIPRDASRISQSAIRAK